MTRFYECLYPLKRKTSSIPGKEKRPPFLILGKEQMKLVIDYHDKKLNHQGSDKILDKLKDDKAAT